MLIKIVLNFGNILLQEIIVSKFESEKVLFVKN